MPPSRNRTGGGRGTNQYQVRGRSVAQQRAANRTVRTGTAAPLLGVDITGEREATPEHIAEAVSGQAPVTEPRQEPAVVPVDVPWGSPEGFREFRAAWQQARERIGRGEAPFPFRYETVTDDPEVTFGIELEVEGVSNVDRLRHEMSQAGLTRGNGTRYSAVDVGYDGTLNASGAEVRTPILTDTPEGWSKFVDILEVMHRHGYEISRRCGGHLNLGGHILGSDTRAWSNLIGEYKRAEDTVIRLATNPGTGEHRNRGTNWSRSNPTPPANGYRTMAHAIDANERPHAVALRGNYTSMTVNRVEFRIFDGAFPSLNPGMTARQKAEATAAIWQARTLVAYGMMRAARDAPGTSSVQAGRDDPEPAGWHRSRWARRRLTGEEWQEATSRVRSHLDRWFPGDPTAKRQVTGLLAVTKWQYAPRRS